MKHDSQLMLLNHNIWSIYQGSYLSNNEDLKSDDLQLPVLPPQF